MHSNSGGEARRPPGAHPDVLELVAFARDELDRGRADRILEHCQSCRECGDDLAATMLLTSLEPPQREPAWRRRAALAAVGVLLLTAGLCFAVWQEGTADRAAVIPDTAPRTLARVPGTVPYPEAHLQRRIELADDLPASTVEELRDLAAAEAFPRRFYSRWFERAQRVADGYADVAAGARRIVQRRYDDAVSLLEESRRVEPESPEVLGMLGAARYLSGDRSDATVELLRAGVDARSFGTWVQWYLANLHLARGEIGRSADTLARLARRHDLAAHQAQALLSRFPAELR